MHHKQANEALHEQSRDGFAERERVTKDAVLAVQTENQDRCDRLRVALADLKERTQGDLVQLAQENDVRSAAVRAEFAERHTELDQCLGSLAAAHDESGRSLQLTLHDFEQRTMQFTQEQQAHHLAVRDEIMASQVELQQSVAATLQDLSRLSRCIPVVGEVVTAEPALTMLCSLVFLGTLSGTDYWKVQAAVSILESHQP